MNAEQIKLFWFKNSNTKKMGAGSYTLAYFACALRRYWVKERWNVTILNFVVTSKSWYLPDGELNPGLPRDRRGYWPLYYRGIDDYF